MNLLGFIMSLVYMQAVHGWLSAYERLVNSQKFFSPYLTQEDMSRFGRNYLQVGFYTEILFPQKEVRFIAVNNSVDSNSPTDNDFTPFLNIMNEWYAKDTSNKIKSIFLSRMSEGKRCSGSIPTVITDCQMISRLWWLIQLLQRLFGTSLSLRQMEKIHPILHGYLPKKKRSFLQRIPCSITQSNAI